MKELSYNLKKYRKQKNLLQKDIAEIIGVSTTFIANIEQGVRTPTIATLQKIANVLNVKVKELFEDIPIE